MCISLDGRENVLRAISPFLFFLDNCLLWQQVFAKEAFMNIKSLSSLSSPLNRGAFKIAGIYLLIGSLWILLSDRLAERIALNKEMLTTLSLYKGLGYVLVTALPLYWLIRRHTGR